MIKGKQIQDIQDDLSRLNTSREFDKKKQKVGLPERSKGSR